MPIFEETDEILEALETKNYLELAKYLGKSTYGFTDNNTKYIDLFWESTFHKKWIHVTEEVVLKQLGYVYTANTMECFYNNLRLNFEVGTDFKEDKYIGMYSEYILTYDGTKQYTISNETYKTLLYLAKTEIAKTTRKYFIRVESLCDVTKQIIFKYTERIRKTEIEEKDQLLLESEYVIKEQQTQLENIHDSNFWVKTCCNNQLTFEKFGNLNKGIYIGKYEIPADALKYDRKIGKTTDIKSRITKYNTGNNPNNEFITTNYEVSLGLEGIVERTIHELIRGFKIKRNNRRSGSKEIFMIPDKWLDIFVANICTQFNKWGEDVNGLIDFIEEKERNFDEVDKHIDILLDKQSSVYEEVPNNFRISIEDIYNNLNLSLTDTIKQDLITQYLRNPDFFFEEAKSQDDDAHWIYLDTNKKKNIYFSNTGYILLCTLLKSTNSNKLVADLIKKIQPKDRYHKSWEDAYDELGVPISSNSKKHLLSRYLRNDESYFKEAVNELDNTAHYIIRNNGKRHDIYFSDSGFYLLCANLKTAKGKEILSNILEKTK